MWASLYPDDTPAPSGTDVQRHILELPKPVIAAVRGHAVGQGCELAGVCDLTIASDTARFGEIQIRHGFPPPTLITPYLVSMKQAKELLMLGEQYDAQSALRLGMANAIVPDDQLEDEAMAMARKLARLPQNVVRLNKALVNRRFELAGLREGLAWRDDPDLASLSRARDATADERHKLRQTAGWDAFKRERDRGYD
jgi:enoyl-CoA hydratase/carnithine racemase